MDFGDKEMQFTTTYNSPLGDILLVADEIGLTGLTFDAERYFSNHLSAEYRNGFLSVFDDTKRWLDIYFKGQKPNFTPALHILGSPFQLSVWNILLKIPYGKTTTYGTIAKEIALQRGITKMSAQAVGGAVGHNEIPIIIPCHRVMGKDGVLTGFAFGLYKKVALLRIEGVAI